MALRAARSRRPHRRRAAPPEPPFDPCVGAEEVRQAAWAGAFRGRRAKTAAAPAPNNSTIDGSGTCVPELELLEVDEPCPDELHL